MNTIENAEYQDIQEYEDKARLEAIYEQLTEMQSRMNLEDFRTRKEYNDMLDITNAVVSLLIDFKTNHQKRKEQYYNNRRACKHPKSL